MQTFDLKRFRVDKKLTQANLAELFSCNQNFISRIESGIRNIPADKLDILQDKYGDISEYYTRTEITESPKQEVSAKEILAVGADAFTRQIIEMMNDKLIAPYTLLEEKDKEIERLNREIGRLEALLEESKKTDVQKDNSADHVAAI